MKTDTKDPLNIAPREERTVLEQLRNDRELIDRLKITPQELEALSRCALLGTMSSKHDMLFILRQIREATSPIAENAVFISAPDPNPNDAEDEDDVPDLLHVPARVAAAAVHHPASLESIVRRRVPEQFGVLFWVLVAVVVLVWNGVSVMSRWRDNFVGAIGTAPIDQSRSSDVWYGGFDRFNVLLCWELLFVGAIAGAFYLYSRRGTRHLKVRPGRRYR
jgi:hypothetical protein